MTQALPQPVPAQPAPPAPAATPKFANAAQWWDALGNVPLHRIVFTPPPGTATEADVLRLEDHADRLCELVDGTLVEKTMGYEESLIAIRIAVLLSNFVFPRKLGFVSGEAGMMRMLVGLIRIPDVAFVGRERLPGGRTPGVPVPDLSPDLAVEVLSDSNTRREMAIKLAEYFASGTKLVWYVDPKSRSVDVYTALDRVQTLSENDTLAGGDVLPGFTVPVAALFDIG